MRTVNCPHCKIASCIGNGHRHVLYGKCGYCHGKRKINAEFIKWEKNQRRAVELRDDELNAIKQKQLKQFEEEWEEKHPRPRKFPKQ